MSWNNSELVNLLHKCAVHCKFKKKDGTLRETVMTTNPSFVPGMNFKVNQPDANGNLPIIQYYDLEAKQWKQMLGNAEFMVYQSFKTLPAKYK